MSHQANFLGRYREAANMARAARLGTDGGRRSDPDRALPHDGGTRPRHGPASNPPAIGRWARPIENFERHTPGEGPDWIRYFDAAELAAELGHCYRDLGRPDSAIEHADGALASASGDYARSDFFAAMVLADAHLDRGDLDEGCRIAAQAIDVGDRLESARCRSYVDEFQPAPRPLRNQPGGPRPSSTQVREHRLWSGIRSQ